MNNIKFIYFDVGGVMLLDFSGTDKWNEMKKDLGITKELDPTFESLWKTHESKTCINDDVDDLIPEIEQITGNKLPKDYSMLIDFVNRFEKNSSIWDMVFKLKENYKVGLLTNMYPRMLAQIKKQELIPDISWDAIVDSSIVGFQKPEEGIYQIAEKMADVEHNEIFFIDNTVVHIEAAGKRGWQTILYDPQNPEKSTLKIQEFFKIK